MPIIGNNTQLYSSGTQLIVQTGGVDRAKYNFSTGTLSEPNHICGTWSGGLTSDVNPGQNFLDPTGGAYVTNGTFTFSGGRFTAPRTGAYRMTASMLARTNVHIWPAKNDGQAIIGAHTTSGTGGYHVLSYSFITYCTAGDTLSFRGNGHSGTVWGGNWVIYTIDYIG